MNPAAFPQLMVAMAEGRALSDVLSAVVRGVAECRHVALARIWLMKPGDVCETCRFAAECKDRTKCLHLVASAGNPTDPAEDLSRLDGMFRRFPLGARKIGMIAATGEPLVIRDVKGDEPWICVPPWIEREGVRTFAGRPLVFRGEVLGVLGLFDREPLTDEDLTWFRTFADHAAVSIANARAFEEIEDLRRRLELENDYLREEVAEALGGGGFVGGSAGLAKVRKQIALVAPTEATVLVTGESGTGKELVARAIHEQSPRRARALIRVNCGAISEHLFESEFFGHVKGAFTGAVKDQPGRFELADGGTIFLDEVGELPPAMQAKLLRVLQEGEYERVGDPRTRRTRARVVAATNRDLRGDVDAGRFRRDLYFRLGVFPIEVPPLRERSEDVGPLAAHFVAAAARRSNLPAPRLTRAAVQALERYDWPGNVRELQNAVERAVILARGGTLRFELPTNGAAKPANDGAAKASGAARGGVDVVAEGAIETRDAWRRREREAVSAALAKTGGRVFGKDGAAELLGMKPTTLASRIKALGLKTR